MVRPGRFAFVKSVVPEEVVEREVAEAMAGSPENAPLAAATEKMPVFEIGAIVRGKVLRIAGDEVIVDIRYKSEGTVPLVEFNHPPRPGEEIEVSIEDLDEDTGEIVLSKRRADRIRGWEKIMSEHKVGDVVKGRAMRKIKGGLLVDIGVPVFLPASQV
ncbi:MAG: S1 RNA-binding domain-containing protein, partial [Planctomycetota bacterium]|nr:S1 RNA-binding domain-containing protein [Planctomycetota bacterium]